ncbi:MAG: cytoplasmic protein [Rhodospirillaceae bacterium]|nr:cytoplasmic protein [Rhodospirillaceae bacterium]
MAQPLMPKATAVWLVDNTSLTFDQIAEFCNLHPLEVKGIADGEVAVGILGMDPIAAGQVTREEITRCEADPKLRLQIRPAEVPLTTARRKGPRYTPVSKRQDRPDAIAWLLKFHPELNDAQISRLLGTTKATIEAVRSRSHWNTPNIKPRDPVLLGICTQGEFENEVAKARREVERARQLAESGIQE